MKESYTDKEHILYHLSKVAFSEGCIDNWVEKHKDFKKALFKLKAGIKSMVRLRNEIFTSLKYLHDYLFNFEIYK